MFPSSVYRSRREALRSALASRGLSDGLVLIPGNSESPRNYTDNAYPFRQDSSFLYFVGPAIPGLFATLDLDSGRAALYGDDTGLDDLIWNGPQPSLAELAELSGIGSARPRASLAGDLAATGGAGRGAPPFLYFPPYRAQTRAELAELTGRPYAQVDAGASLTLVRAAVGLRELKSPEEAAEIEAAVAATVDMHKAALATARPGMLEADVAARVTQVALAQSSGLSFPLIATTRGSVFHTHEYGRRLEAGGLFLLDAGAESALGYAGDLTTTFPIGQRYDARQREIYEIVLAAHAAATRLLGPGRNFREVHFSAARAIAEGLKTLGLLKGEVEEAVAAGAHALFFPHGVGHMMGLDVHDMESYGEDLVGYEGEPRSPQFGLAALRLAKPLKPGMVHTVEPGVYFIPELIAQWKAEGRLAEFIAYDKLGPYMAVSGIRNEEDWIVTADGARRLGPAFDKSAQAIERYRA